jgi:sulfatase maturation enzyme AslB (radical SAM superfamily)
LESGWHLSPETARDARRLLFLGGESLMHQDLILDSLQLVKNHGELAKLEVVICTNMTLSIRSEIVELLGSCQYVTFSCSIDGYGPLNDYIRSDSKWSDVLSTSAQMLALCRSNDHIKMHIHPVISIMNVNQLIDLFDWWDSLDMPTNTFGYIWCHSPRYYDANHLPAAYKRQLIGRYQSAMVDYPGYAGVLRSIIAQLSAADAGDAAYQLAHFKRITGILDDRRGLRLSDHNPDIAAVCGL